MDTTIRIRAEDEATAVIERVRNEFVALGREFSKAFKQQSFGAGLANEANTFSRSQREAVSTLRQRFSFEQRMNRQRQAEAKQAADAEKLFQGDAVAALKQRMAFSSRMYRQQAQEARDSAREQARQARDLARQQAEIAREVGRAARQAAQEQAQQARDAARQQVSAARSVARAAQEQAREQAAALRGQIAQTRELERARARAVSSMAGGLGQVRSGATRTVVAGAATAAVAGHAARRGIDTLTRSGVGIDEALTQASIHIYGQLPASEARKAAESLRQRLMPVATKLGSSTADLIGAYVEASQAGVDNDILDKVTEFGSKYAKMNKLSLPNTLEETGYALQGLKSFGTVTDKTVADYFNHMSYLVATTAANRTQMSSFGKRGLAAGASIGMSADDTLAFGAAATAAGAEGNQAARMLSTTDKRVAGWNYKARDIARKHHRTEEDRLFLAAPGLLGFSSHGSMADAFRSNPFESLVQAFEGLKKIADPLKRLQLEKELFGQEFGTFTDAMVMGGNLREYRNKLKSPEASNFIEQNWSKQTGAFGFIVDQIKSVFDNMKDSLGLALKPFWSDLRDYAVQTPAAFGAFEDAFRASLSGFVSGLGSPDGTLAGLLRAWFGNPAEFKLDAAKFGAFAKGLGEGIRSIASAITATASLFGSGSGGYETMGRLTGQFMALSVALVALSPALAALGGLITMVRGIGALGRGLAGLFRLGGILGTAEAGTGAAAVAGIGASLLSWFGLGIAGWLGSHRGEIVTVILDAFGAIWEAFKKDFRKRFTLKNFLDELTPAWIKRQPEGQGKGPSYGAPDTKVPSGLPVEPTSYNPPGSGGSGQGFFGRLGHRVAAAFGFGGGHGGPGGGVYSGSGGGAVSGKGNGKMPLSSDAGTLTDLINAEAKRAGIDPRIMQGIRAGESGHRADYDKKDDAIESSWGPYQLNRRKGLGVQFEKETGLDVRDPKTIPAQTRWVAEFIAKGGRRVLGNWMGYHGDRDADPKWGNSGYVPNNPVGSGGGLGPLAGDGGDIGKRLASMKSAGAISGDECVALAKAAVGVSGSVKDWRRGDVADAGTLKPGTPIATFLNRDGSQSERYAGGGTGTRGAHTDHAAVFEKYITGKDGKPIGMQVAEQYANSGGVRQKKYLFGQGFGEANGSNYHAIKSAVEGSYLGGKNNPMNGITPPSPAEMAGSVAGARAGDAMMGATHHHHGPVSIHLANPPDDPDATAKSVQKTMAQQMNRRAHDVEFNFA